MKLGQLIEYNKRNIYSLLMLFFKNFILGNSKWSAAWFHYISIALKLAYNKNKLLKTLQYWARDMLKSEHKSLITKLCAHYPTYPIKSGTPEGFFPWFLKKFRTMDLPWHFFYSRKEKITPLSSKNI